MITDMTTRRVLAFPHRPQPHGGPGSFQIRLSHALEARGWTIVYADSGVTPDVVLVVAGTRKLAWLWRCKSRGARIVHRLDGFNWRYDMMPLSWKHRQRQKLNNLLMRTIRSRLADHVIYQSQFVRASWHDRFGPAPCPDDVIYNGVDLCEFRPESRTGERPLPRLLCVEGSVHDSPAYVRPIEQLTRYLCDRGLVSETLVCGQFEADPESELAGLVREGRIRVMGSLPREEMPEVYRNSLYLVLEVHPACPNSVVEALASGAPVIGFDSGSLSELVSDTAGSVLPYGADPWKMQVPDVAALGPAAETILESYASYSDAARRSAEERFGIDEMVERYVAVLEAGL